MGLRTKAVEGLSWSAAAQIAKQASQFIVITVLARLLSPDDFGILGMALVFTNFAAVFNEMGIGSALIQKQDAEDRHYCSAFWLNIAAGFMVMFLVMISSPYIALFYGKPELRPIIMVISLDFVITSFIVVQKALFAKKMEFKKLAIVETLAIIISGAVGIYFAYRGHGVWSLVYQVLTLSLTNVVLLWVLSDWRPKFIFSVLSIKDILGFSAHVTGFNIINYFSRNIDYLLIGKFLGAQALGFYTLAYKIMLYPLQNISGMIGKVMFPAFSKIGADLARVRSAYIKMVRAIAAIVFPIMCGLFVIAPEFVKFLYGTKWEPVVILIRIFCICGLVQSVGTTVGTIYLSQGRADLQFRLQLIGTAIVCTSVVIGLRWGINGVALFYTLQAVFWVYFNFRVVAKLIGLDYLEFCSRLNVFYLTSGVMAIMVMLVKKAVALPLYLELVCLIASGALVYFVLLISKKEIVFEKGRPVLSVLR